MSNLRTHTYISDSFGDVTSCGLKGEGSRKKENGENESYDYIGIA